MFAESCCFIGASDESVAFESIGRDSAELSVGRMFCPSNRLITLSDLPGAKSAGRLDWMSVLVMPSSLELPASILPDASLRGVALSTLELSALAAAFSDLVPGLSERVIALSERVTALSDLVTALSDRGTKFSDLVTALSVRVTELSVRVPVLSLRMLELSSLPV